MIISPVISLSLDSSLNVISSNEEFKHLFPIHSSVVCFTNMLHEEDINPVREVFYNKTTPVCISVKTLICGDGSFPVRVSYDWSIIKLDDGTFTVYGKRTSPHVSSEEHKELLDFFNNAPIALHWLDSTGHVLWANNRELEVLGYTREEYIGQPIMNFCPDSEEEVLEIFKQLGSGNTIKDVPVRFRTKEGDIRDLLVDSNVNFKPDGSFNHTRCFIRDDTQRKIREARERVSKELADQLDAEKANFVSKLLHEVKTPMHIITMTATSPTMENNVIVSQINRISRLIENINYAMKFDSGNIIHMHRKYVNIHTLIETHIDFLHTVTNCTIKLEIEPTTQVDTDPEIIKHIISELVENAANRCSDVIIHISKDDNQLIFRVKDNGDMIPQEDVHRVFQNYWMSDIGRVTYDNPGIGIGLNIAFNLVQCMGSVLKVFSNKDETMFEFGIDIDDTNLDESSGNESSESWGCIDNSKVASRHMTLSKQHSTQLECKHILLVEDNTICQKICHKVITKVGHTCDIASNGKIATEMVHENRYDLIFMDIRMPIMDGIKSASIISKDFPRIPIIALSAEESDEIYKNYSSYGFKLFLKKPSASKDILECIRKYT